MLGALQSASTSSSALIAGAHLHAGVGGALVILVLGALDGARVRRARLRGRAAHGLGRGGAGPLPALLRVPLPLLEQPAPRAAEDRLVSHRRDLEPDLLPDRGLSQPVHLRLGRDRAARAASPWPSACSRSVALRRSSRCARGFSAHERLRANRLATRAPGGERLAAWRSRSRGASLHTYVRRPDLFVPSLVFPLVFLASFAGGLSALGLGPGLSLPRRLHRVPVRLRALPVGDVRRALHRLHARVRLRERLRAAPDARRRGPPRDRARLRARRRSPARRSRWRS